MKKINLLSNNIKNIDVKSFDSSHILNSMKPMSSSESQLVEATELYSKMLNDNDCNIILSISDNSCTKGCLRLFANMIELKMVDAIIVNGNNLMYYDFLEALGFNLFKGLEKNTNSKLDEFYICTSNGTFIDDNDLQYIDLTIKEIADQLQARTYSSKEFLYELGRYLQVYSTNKRSVLQLAFENEIPIYSPSLACSKLAGGLLDHQWERPDHHMLIDPILDLSELIALKSKSKNTGLILLGNDTISDVAFDIVSYTKVIGRQTRRHKYAIQIVKSNAEGELSETIMRNTINRDTIKNVNMEPNLALPLIISQLQYSKQLKERLYHHIN
ncbi:deoxyhypusine synthase family protein [Ancylomarina sp. 16SWW S1-10-2]|uniref:deoxyhypusine synthase family protein n=1 Tax=Ancylomarina sp. 16SWW S1-10-2 TaxID=2499681 RepID=UPI0018A02632|nr:deoxyhypusine synthase family protein [Ancylomarina sp. 16SWW S1-10-2]